MHPSLSTPEIFRRILDFVNVHLPGFSPFEGYDAAFSVNPSLASLARTCKTFLEPTLNVLWYTQTTLVPLVRTLPEDLWIEDVVGYVSRYGEKDPVRRLVRHHNTLLTTRRS